MKEKKQSIADLIRESCRAFFRVTQRLGRGLWWQPLALLAVAGYWFSISTDIPKPSENTVEKFGVYGDSFGKLTSLFTALGFGGLIITLLLQQRQIRSQEEDSKQNRQKEEKIHYEQVLFRLLDIYRQTLSEVKVGESVGRDVLRSALDRVDSALLEEQVHCVPGSLQSKRDSQRMSERDLQCMDYLYYRNFKIVATEIHPQSRLVDTFEVLLQHMVHGAPNHLLIDSYRELVFAQITFIECRYFFLVALSHTTRSRLRGVLAKTGFFDRISRSQTHRIHRDMYKEFWGQSIAQRDIPPSIPMNSSRIGRALSAHRTTGAVPKTTYSPIGVRESKRRKSRTPT